MSDTIFYRDLKAFVFHLCSLQKRNKVNPLTEGVREESEIGFSDKFRDFGLQEKERVMFKIQIVDREFLPSRISKNEKMI